MKIHHYSVFAAAPGGGKQFAIVEGVTDPAEMQRIAASSGQPLTGFILNAEWNSAEVRFFSPTKEKGSSDSGALVVGEHLRLQGADWDIKVQTGEEILTVTYGDFSSWYSHQGESKLHSSSIHHPDLFRALGISQDDIAVKPSLAGGGKLNVIISLTAWQILERVNPDFALLEEVQKSMKVNGFVVGYLDASNEASIRFFSPAKQILEDNAGSYTVASVCGFSVAECHPGHSYHIEVDQGHAMGKPSRLYALFDVAKTEERVATNIRVGGKVELLEVTTWD